MAPDAKREYAALNFKNDNYSLLRTYCVSSFCIPARLLGTVFSILQSQEPIQRGKGTWLGPFSAEQGLLAKRSGSGFLCWSCCATAECGLLSPWWHPQLQLPNPAWILAFLHSNLFRSFPCIYLDISDIVVLASIIMMIKIDLPWSICFVP